MTNSSSRTKQGSCILDSTAQAQWFTSDPNSMKEPETGLRNFPALRRDGTGSGAHPAPEPIGTAKYLPGCRAEGHEPDTPSISMQYRSRKRGALTPLPHAWCLIRYGHNVTFTASGYGNIWLQDRWRYWGMQRAVTAGNWYRAEVALYERNGLRQATEHGSCRSFRNNGHHTDSDY